MSLVVSYGGGTNSVAMLIGLREHEERPDAIVFADTGGEKPRTYGHLLVMQQWCERIGFPSITIVRASTPMNRRDVTLEGECFRLGTLPSRAMGRGSCSDKWKIDPFEKWLKASPFYADSVCLIGYDADEPERATRRERYGKPCRYPLMEWDWGRDECLAAIARENLPDPGKSACFFCPSSKAQEILRLHRIHPRYLDRALAMEARALNGEGQAPALHSVKGLGRRFAWSSLIHKYDALLTEYGRVTGKTAKLTPASRQATTRHAQDEFSLTPEECGEGCFT